MNLEKEEYQAIHRWVRRHKPKKEFCELCGKKKQLVIANISGNYLKDIDDYEWLCYKCHLEKDGVIKKLQESQAKSHENNRYIHKVPEGFKPCSKCKRILPKTEFWKNRTKWDGLQDRCKECMREIRKEYYRKYKK